jgi:asparagine synthetase B (glutamine-hydrolysing)
MPGLIAVLGPEDAGARLEQAARPLLRRPWHRLDVLADPAERVAVGFAGERGGVAASSERDVLVAFDGELFADIGPLAGAAAARELLDRYLVEGPSLDPPDGSFAACVWDPASGRLHLLTDRIGSRPLYYARSGSALLVAGELKALVAAGLRPELDLEAWAGLLAYEHVVGDRTTLAGASLVPPGTTLALSRSGQAGQLRRWRFRLEPENDRTDKELVDEFAAALDRAIARRLDDRSALALSGGLDSRCLAAVLRTRRPATASATYGAPGSEDLGIGLEVAARAGLTRRSLAFEPGWVARGAAETVWLAEGHVRCFHGHHLALRTLRREAGLEALLIGFCGDLLLRGGRNPVPDGGESALAAGLHRDRNGVLRADAAAEVLPPAFATEIQNLALGSLSRALLEEEGDPVSRRRQWVWNQEQRRKVLPGAHLFADDLAARDPFADPDVIDLCRRIPEHLRLDANLELALLRRHPRLAALRDPKSGLAPRWTGRGRAIAEQLAHQRQRARKVVDRTLGPSRLPDRRGLGDYATDLRRHGAGLLEILLEDRTLDRGQIEREAVAKLVSQTLGGRARNTGVLGVLLTLELFQRQFVDGDAPATFEPYVYRSPGRRMAPARARSAATGSPSGRATSNTAP